MKILTLNELKAQVPSAFATGVASTVSRDRYTFISTEILYKTFLQEGYLPVRASEVNTRIQEADGFQKHMIRFTHSAHLKGFCTECRPDVILVNSHDGRSSFFIMEGRWRPFCDNDLIVGGTVNAHYFRHSGGLNVLDNVVGALYDIMASKDVVETAIAEMSECMLNDSECQMFAEFALDKTIGRSRTLLPTSDYLLRRRRSGDMGNSVWKVFNAVQENVIRGRYYATVKTKKGRKTRLIRGVNSVNASIDYNRKLWDLAIAFTESKLHGVPLWEKLNF